MQEALASANEDPERCFFINDTGGYDYEVLGKGRLLGSIQPWFRRPWTYSQTFTAKCFLHASKCKHILAVKGRSNKELFDILGMWLSKATELDIDKLLACRPT